MCILIKKLNMTNEEAIRILQHMDTITTLVEGPSVERVEALTMAVMALAEPPNGWPGCDDEQ